MRPILFFLSVLCIPALCAGQSRVNSLTPKWMHSAPKSKSKVIQYKTIILINPSEQNVSTLALGELARNVENEWTIQEREMYSQANKLRREGTRIVENDRVQIDTIEIHADGKVVTLNCKLADEFWGIKDGVKRYYALYQLSANRYAVFDKVYPTNYYGIGPLFMSVIPGVGQYYKGDPVKGSLFMGGCLVTGIGAFFLENQRQAYKNQLSQTHDINLIRKLSANEQNCATARNVTIGLAAAAYLYNLIDAAIAPGARKVKVKPGGVNFSF